ncbi:hypothetical protein B5F77_02390 [Parabacteroides sp. An277]|nr:hypothetical protein B5F77_02390 [Parabacteroides sp. An277]
MLKRDFIMVQIEELGKAIAQLVFNRNAGNGPDKNPEIIGQSFRSLKTDTAFLLNHEPDEIELALNGEDGCGLERMELAAKLLIEESYLSSVPLPLLNKAQELLYYLQIHDTAFSLERMMLLQDIEVEIKRLS